MGIGNRGWGSGEVKGIELEAAAAAAGEGGEGARGRVGCARCRPGGWRWGGESVSSDLF